jgi:hypothetical protein
MVQVALALEDPLADIGKVPAYLAHPQAVGVRSGGAEFGVRQELFALDHREQLIGQEIRDRLVSSQLEALAFISGLPKHAFRSKLVSSLSR